MKWNRVHFVFNEELQTPVWEGSLPDEDETVFVTTKNGKVTDAVFTEYDNGYIFDDILSEEVLAWMSYPEPYNPDEPEKEDEFLNTKDLAKILKFNQFKIYELMKEDGLPYYKMGRVYRFRWDEVKSWILKHKVEVTK